MHIRYILPLILLFTTSCQLLQFTEEKPPEEEDPPQYRADLEEVEFLEPIEFKGKKDRVFNIIHTVLDLEPDWEEEALYGEATLTITPHFYSRRTIELDAKGFSINEVELDTDTARFPAEYEYDRKKLTVEFPEIMDRYDTVDVVVDYTAHPYDEEYWYEDPHPRDRGLHFIEPAEHRSHIPRQVWTQGQPKSASSWFPTIDAPYQRMTQEVFITVDPELETLSNGEFIYSTQNPDGTKTDYWELTSPHAPYLAVMIAGDFATIEEPRSDIPMEYWLESRYEGYAEEIFSKTPEMMEFFEELTQTPYPWDKYFQVAVRDFFAGGMENTGAVVYFENIQRSPHELIDEDYESFLAHEMAHHWFGNLVSTASWGEIFINEGLATYSSYLWKEHEYGKSEAEYYRSNEWQNYLAQAGHNKRAIVDQFYNHPIDNFDQHTYQKAALIFHYLRDRLGDQAFFASLSHLFDLHNHEGIDRHQLRHVFEKVSGKDLELFFKQWFEEPGHPKLHIERYYDEEGFRHGLIVRQEQDLDEYPLYDLPATIRVHSDEEQQDFQARLQFKKDTFYIPPELDPDLIEWDPEYVIPAERTEKKDLQNWEYQFQNASHIKAKIDALQAIGEKADSTLENDTINEVFERALNHDSHIIRKEAVKSLPYPDNEDQKERLYIALSHDENPNVRRAAIEELMKLSHSNLEPFEERIEADSSYNIKAAALEVIYENDNSRGLTLAGDYMDAHNDNLLLAAGQIFADKGDPDHAEFFREAKKNMFSPQRYQMFNLFAQYLPKTEDPELIGEQMDYWEDHIEYSRHKKLDFKESFLSSALRNLNTAVREIINEKEDYLEEMDREAEDYGQISDEVMEWDKIKDRIEELLSNNKN